MSSIPKSRRSESKLVKRCYKSCQELLNQKPQRRWSHGVIAFIAFIIFAAIVILLIREWCKYCDDISKRGD